MNGRRIVLLLVIVLAVLAVSLEPALAQCAMCKAALENSVDAQASAAKLNLGILILLAPPVAIFTGLFAAIYRLRNLQGGRRDCGRPQS